MSEEQAALEIEFDDLSPGGAEDRDLDAQLDQGQPASKKAAPDEDAEFEVSDLSSDEIDGGQDDLAAKRAERIEVVEGDDDDQPMTKAEMRAEIERLRAEVNEQLDNGASLVIEESDRRVQRLEKRLQLNKDRESANQELVGVDEELTTIRGKLRDAIERGKTDLQLDLQEKLADLKVKRREVETRIEGFSTTEADLQKEEEAGKGRAPTQVSKRVADPKITTLANSFVESNADWYGKDAEITEFARFVDKQLAAKKMDATSPTYWAELQRRVHLQYPDKVAAPGGNDDAETRPRNGGGGGPAHLSRGGGGANRRGSITLTRRDLNTMERFGLDPKNPEHQKEFARNKAESRA